MGCWGVDPLDNDIAAVWLIHFEETPADRRPAMIRTALLPAVVGSDGYLDSEFAFEALAAASVLVDGEQLGLGVDLSDLAVAALDRIGSDKSEWRSLWQDAGRESLDMALGSLHRLRAALQPARGRERSAVGDPPEGDECRAGSLKYLTYTKYNPATGHVFYGRISGLGEPRQILEAYDRRHGLNGQGFEAAILDVWCEATKPYAARLSDPAYGAIRGREHLGIAANSGTAR
jgi:hypothetical protein